MSGHEARINDALKQLGEEFRLGMIAAEDYRARRRALFESWGERDVTTSPGSLRAIPGKLKPAPTQTRIETTMAPAQRRRSGVPLALIGIGALLLVAAGAWFALGWSPAPGGSTVNTAPAQPAPSPQVTAVKKAADEFLSRNVWEPDAIASFLAQWRQLAPGDRAQARDAPALRTLRYELERNIQAEAQLLPPDAPPEQRQRLDALTEFARELES
jgi:hypothetical protein